MPYSLRHQLHQGTNQYAASSYVIKELNISPVLFKLSMIKLINKGFAKWFSGDTHVTATENKGLTYAFENKLVT